jgi:hypothetical protein
MFTIFFLTADNHIRSLSDLGNRSENSAGRGQILSILKVNSCSIDQESGEIWTVQTDLQQIYPKSDRLLVSGSTAKMRRIGWDSAAWEWQYPRNEQAAFRGKEQIR